MLKMWIFAIVAGTFLFAGDVQASPQSQLAERASFDRAQEEKWKNECAKGEMEACASFGGRLMLSLPDGDARLAEVIAPLSGACDAGIADACDSLARAYNFGRGVSRDLLRTLAFDERACALKKAQNCLTAGGVFFNGINVAKDEARAFTLFEKACDLGAATACKNVALFHYEGKNGLSKSASTTLIYLTKACELGDRTACPKAGEMTYNGNEVSQDLPLARKMFAVACASATGAEYCQIVGQMHERGRGGPVNVNTAITYYQAAARDIRPTLDYSRRRLAELGISVENPSAKSGIQSQ